MEFFLETTNTIAKGHGFSHYSALHLTWLGVFLAVTVLCCIHYHRLSQRGRGIWRKTLAVLTVANEVFKQVCLIIGGRWLPEYLPLHLCSINIFLMAYHCIKPVKLLGNFMYTVCIPGALAALLFPSWTALPLGNFMHIHSFTVHMMLALYPIVLTVNGDIRPQIKTVPACLLVLVVLAAIMWVINPYLDANFFFMASADKGNPLYWFQENWGNHLYGFPVLVAAIVAVMHGPIFIWRKIKQKKAE